MPIYEYSCEKCGKLVDVFQKISDPAPAKCEGCGAEGTMSRKVSRTSFVLKGGGWYSDLYSSTKKDSGGSGSGSESASSSGSTPSSSSAAATTTTASSSSTSSSSSASAPSATAVASK